MSRILSVRFGLQEKLAEDGSLVREIRSAEETSSRIREELSASRTRLEAETAELSKDSKAFAAAYAVYKKTVEDHNAGVALLAGKIRRYNQLADEYNRFAEILAFLQHNRLDRPAVFARIRYLRI